MLSPNNSFKLFKRAGFVVDRIVGSHHILYRDDHTPPITVPFHSKDLKLGTLSAILKQAHISVEELIELL